MSGWSHAPSNQGGAIHPHRAFPHNSSAIVLGEAWLDTYSSQPGQPTYIVVQPPAPEAKPAEPPKPVTPLLIEWQGNRFVRTTGVEPLLRNGSAAPQASTDYVQTGPEENRPSSPSAPITLIFRDGHREQIQNYSIIDDCLYASSDYAQSGKWMKTISLSALNLPATIEANRETGASFALPTAANVVVTNF